MKHFSLLFILLSTSVFSNPDLVISSSTMLNTNSVKIYDKIKLINKVKNIGTAASSASYLRIYLSKDLTFSAEEEIGLVSVPALSINAVAESNFIYTISKKIDYPSNYYVGYKVDATNIVTESNESNFFYNPTVINVPAINLIGLKNPYPIIFVHGLNNNGLVWRPTTNFYDSILSYRYGGQMNFCLNYDNNTYTSNLTNDYHDFTQALNESNLTAADYYYINFSINYQGDVNSDNYVHQSSQSAIHKQAVAVKDAIRHVRNVTGADKVILVGYSMGGLATRTYLANSTLWQADNAHHVAKLFTIGTPHGGSNSTGGWLNILSDLDGDSEACRDLRYPSFSLDFHGKFLFGGTESATSNGGFNNDDINCNGIIGNTIVGLNSKSLPNNLPYACFFATGSALGGDGIVDDDRANLNNYGLTNNTPTIIADTIINDEFVFIQNHIDIVDQYATVIRGIDEPNTINHAYEIKKNKMTQALINRRSNPTANIFDYDYFFFNQTTAGTVYLDVCNIQQPSFKVVVYNSSYQVVATYLASRAGSISQSLSLASGKYYIEVTAQHSTSSWEYPYYINVGSTPYFNPNPTTDIASIDSLTPIKTELNVFPNPASNYVDVNITGLNSEMSDTKIVVRDISGKELYTQSLPEGELNIQHHINLENFESGLYFITITNNMIDITKKIMVIQ